VIENETLDQKEVLARLKLAGLIACLPGDLPMQKTLVVVDALLAAPILAVEVSLVAEDTAVIRDILNRAKGAMTVGAKVETAGQARTALETGAHFITTEQWQTAVWQRCQTLDTLYIPGAMAAATVAGIQKKGCETVRLRTGGVEGAAFAAMICHHFSGMLIMIDADVTPETVGHYGRAGSGAVFVSGAIYKGCHQKMTDIINRARALQKGWESYED